MRQIDAAATARTGVPHVRLHVPERTLTTWIVARRLAVDGVRDGRPAEGRRRRGRGARARAAGRRRAGRVALMTFGAGRPRLVPPRGRSRASIALRRALAEGVAPDGGPTATRWPTRCAAPAGRAPAGLVVVDLRLPRPGRLGAPLGALRAATRCSPSRSPTRARLELPAVGRLALVDPETGERVEVDTSRRARARALRRARARAPRGWSRASCGGCEVEHVTLSTEGDWLLDAREDGCDELRAPPAGCSRCCSCRWRSLAYQSAVARGARAVRGPLPGRARRSRWPPGARRRGGARCRSRSLLAVARGAGARAGQAAEDGRGAGRAGVGHARHRPLGLDGGRRRRADPAGGGASAPRTRSSTSCPHRRARRRRRVLRRARRRRRRRRPTTTLVRRMVDAQIADGGTATGDALQVALDTLQREPRGTTARRPPSAIVLLSDGATTTGRDPVGSRETARQLKIPIYTVALGTRDATVPNPGRSARRCCRSPPDPETLQRIADASGGRGLHRPGRRRSWPRSTRRSAPSSARETRNARSPPRSPSPACLLLGAAAASTRWAGRVP